MLMVVPAETFKQKFKCVEEEKLFFQRICQSAGLQTYDIAVHEAFRELKTTLIKVTCVYGDVLQISKADYDNPTKTQLPFYTKTGKRFMDTQRGQRAFRHGKAVTIHRLNIKEVLA